MLRLASAIVEHHLADETNPGFSIRPATILDATEIAHLSDSPGAPRSEGVAAGELVIRERLAIASGDDYFTIVATSRASGAVLGWLGGGGCRGQEMKGWGELYAFATTPGEATEEIEVALVRVALRALRNAQFAGVTVQVASAEVDRIARLVALGFIHAERDAHASSVDACLVMDFVAN